MKGLARKSSRVSSVIRSAATLAAIFGGAWWLWRRANIDHGVANWGPQVSKVVGRASDLLQNLKVSILAR